MENGISSKEESSKNISEYLKQLREKKGISIEEASNTLKISHEYIKAFEDGNFDSLPLDTYIKIFLRAYTEHLDGDSKKVMAWFAELRPGKNRIKSFIRKPELIENKNHSFSKS